MYYHESTFTRTSDIETQRRMFIETVVMMIYVISALFLTLAIEEYVIKPIEHKYNSDGIIILVSVLIFSLFGILMCCVVAPICFGISQVVADSFTYRPASIRVVRESRPYSFMV